MSTPPKIKAARPGGKAAFKTSHYANQYYKKLGDSQHAPKDLLPSPQYYYKGVFGCLPNHVEWASVKCCFHPDSRPSLSVNLKSGGFFCHGCGARGGDLIDFVRLNLGADFPTAVALLKQARKEELSCL